MKKHSIEEIAKNLFDAYAQRKYILEDELRFENVDPEVVEELQQINHELNRLRKTYGL